MLTRRNLVELIVFGVAFSGCAPVQGALVIRPEDFGAKGDGKAYDGQALAAMVDHINGIAGASRITAVCNGQYLLKGAPERVAAPQWMKGRKGITRGLPPVTRDNVTIDARGGTFVVPADQPFQRIVRGGSADDRFFVMWQFLGRNAVFQGGTIDGNLGARPARRGPKPAGFGGEEFGLVMEGENWFLDSVTSANWGTDCALITNYGRALKCTFERARRNGVSIVANRLISKEAPVTIEQCRFLRNGDWPDDLYNNPAAGMVIEANKMNYPASAVIKNCEFEGNLKKDLQLAKSSYDCIVMNNVFTNDVRLRPMQNGGHVIEDNRFEQGARILITSTGSDAQPVSIQNNMQDGRLQPERGFIRHTLSNVDDASFVQDVLD